MLPCAASTSSSTRPLNLSANQVSRRATRWVLGPAYRKNHRAGPPGLIQPALQHMGMHDVFEVCVQVLTTPRSSPVASDARCVACQSACLPSVSVRAPCDHSYCSECIVHLFESSMTDESLMPPRCCRQAIPVDLIYDHLAWDTILQFTEKNREFGTRNRLYCPQERCSTFIGEASNTPGSSETCPKCDTAVCSYCKTLQHPRWERCSLDKDPASRAALQLGERNGWRRCGECRRLVELNQGW